MFPKYSLDKPDMLFEMLINDITDVFTNTEFMMFKSVLEENGIPKRKC